MRKNKSNRKALNLYIVYEISGLNLDNLVNILKNKCIHLQDIKKSDNKTLTVAVNYKDNKKFFAITRNLCYNVKRIGEKGRFRIFSKLWRNVGLVIGAILFTVCSVIADDYVFAIDYCGTGSVVAREIDGYLKSHHVTTFTRFSDLNLTALSDEILAASDKISFAECVKCGNRLKINLALSNAPVKTLDGDKESIVSDVDGEIEYVKVYRGTALKKAGDRVLVGEEICGGYAVIKDTVVKVGVIATVAIKAEFIYDYVSDNPEDETAAEIFAVNSFGDGEILSSAVGKTALEDGLYEYKVKIIYRKILC